MFDEAKGRWVNLDEDESESGPAAPPPMDPAFTAAQPAAAGPAAGPAPAGGGPPAAAPSFRAGLTSRRAGRGYVDVLSQSGMAKPNQISAPGALLPNGGPAPGPPAMLTPAAGLQQQEAGPSSLQAEDSSSSLPPMMFNPSTAGTAATADTAAAGPPMMFNPSSLGTASMPPNF